MGFELLLKKLYQAAINDFTITDNLLLSIGFSYEQINYLCTTKKIQPLGNDTYQFIDARNLIHYAKALIAKKDSLSAELCFAYVKKIDPYNHELCFHYFYKAISEYRFKDAFVYFQIIYKYENTSKEDYNFYLYMFGVLIDLPEKYKKICANLHFIDLKSHHKNNSDIYNKIRKCAFDGCFGDALKLLKEFENTNKNLSATEVMTKRFLTATRRKQFLERKEIVSLLELKEYDKIIELLEQIQSQVKLNDETLSVLSLLKTYQVISLTNTIPPKKPYYKNSVYTAIKKFDYESALRCITLFNERHHYENSASPIYLILQLINQKISEINANNLPHKEMPEEAIKEEYTSEVQEIADTLKEDIEASFSLIQEYLTKLGRLSYFPIIKSLLMININRPNAEYNFVLNILNSFNDPNYEIDLTIFAYKYYHAKIKGRLKEANIFYDIIRHLKHEKTLIPEQYLPSDTKIVSNYYFGIIKNYAKHLWDTKGIVILEEMPEEERLVVYNLVRNYLYLYAFRINVQNKPRIVIKYQEPIFREEEYTELLELGNIAYENADYDDCIKYFNRLIADTKVKGFVYSKIGHAYLKKHEYEQALLYLMVGNSLYQDEREKYEYSDLIVVLESLCQTTQNRVPN